MDYKDQFEDEPCFQISVVARMLDLHPQTIRNYERIGLVAPSRSDGNVRLFSTRDLKKLRQITSYTELGVNLAGVEVIVRLLNQMDSLKEELENEMDRMKQEMETLRKRFME